MLKSSDTAEAYMDAQVETFGKMVESFMKKKLWCPASHTLNSVSSQLGARKWAKKIIAVRWAGGHRLGIV